MKFNSIKFKVSVIYSALLGFILIIYSAILYFSLSRTLYSDLDEELKIKAQEIGKMVNKYLDIIGPDSALVPWAIKRTIFYPTEEKYLQRTEIKEIESTWLKKADKLDIKQAHINFLDSKAKSIVYSLNLSPQLIPIFSETHSHAILSEVNYSNIKFKKWRLRTISFPFNCNDGKQYIIQVGISLKPIIKLLQNRMLYIVYSIPIILLLTGWSGHFFALRILKPVAEITQIATSITHEDLKARVKREHIDEEMKYLVDAFNNMISRLEKAFSHIGEFSSNVAHELKTPLAVIRGECEVALRKDREREEYKRVLNVTLQEIIRMLKTIDDLLLLSKLEYHPQIFKFESFNLNTFVKEIYEQTKILVSSKGLLVELKIFTEPINITGDILHLRRLLFNIINNAIKFSYPKGTISITLKTRENNAIISIANTGIGIPEEELPKIFDRFFHIDRMEEHSEAGNGLGLAIALSIAEIHNGRIEVKSEYKKEAIFKVILPTN